MARRVPAQPAGTPHATAGPREEMERLREPWFADEARREQTVERMWQTASLFANRLAATGVPSLRAVTPADAAAFVHARSADGEEPRPSTMHFRRSAVRMLFRALRLAGEPVADPTLDLLLPPRGEFPARPLTDDEIALGRLSSRVGGGARSLHRAVVWALAEATAVTGEIPVVTLDDLDDPAVPTRVALPGTGRHDPRVGVLSGWGAQVLAAHTLNLINRGAVGRSALIYTGRGSPRSAKAQACACNALRRVLNTAGLLDEPDVRPASVRHWAGRRLFDAGEPVQTVARALGLRSLDACAADIALEWREGPR